MNRLGGLVFRHTSRISSRCKACQSAAALRQFHLSSLHHARKDSESEIPSKSTKHQRAPFKFSIEGLAPEERSTYKSLSPEEQAKWRDEAKQMHDYYTSPEMDSMIQGLASQAASEVQREIPHFEFALPTVKPGYFNYGEEEYFDTGEDEEFQGDDINSLGHGELEQHREMRQYARIAAWEMPLLSSTSPSPRSPLTGQPNNAPFLSPELAKPFTPPSSDRPLRFRYTTYMGETHPASKKIVLEFTTKDLLTVLTERQRTKLIKLVGPRYNPSTDVVKMSSEMFETQAQNKRYLGDLVDTLIDEARNEEDMFEDVPFDFRHHKEKKEVVFPEGWKLTEERRRQLEVDRERRALGERRREQEGRVLVGTRIIEQALQAVPVRDESKLLLEVEQGKRGKLLGKGKQKLRR